MGALELLRHPGVKRLPLGFKLFIARRFGLLSPSQDRVMERGGKRYISMHVPPLGTIGFDRFVDAHVRESRGERVPEIATVSVTSRCAGDCWHCLYSLEERRSGDFIPLDAMERAAREMAEMGTYSILLTGGDPLEHPNIREIVGLFDDRFIVNMATPGRLLTGETAKALASAGLAGVFIGLDSPDPETNDTYRGTGSYDTAVRAIGAAKDADLLTGIFSVIRREQLEKGELRELMELAKRLGVDEVNLFEPVSPREELLTLEERSRLGGLQPEYNGKRGYPKVISGPYMDSPLFMGCTAGFNRLFIDHTGDVRPCQLLPVSYGNITEDGLQEIWERMALFEKPGNRCLFLDNYDVISAMGKGEGLTPGECREICAARGDVPLYYRKLGIR